MSDPEATTALVEATRPLGWEIDAARAEALLRWRDRLLQQNLRVNLTGVRDPDEAIPRLVLDSLAIGLHLAERPLEKGATACDLGTGGGLPGMPLAIVRPDLSLTLVESRLRKVDAVRRIANQLRIGNVDIRRGRLSELAAEDPGLQAAFSLVTARAVGSLAEMIVESADIIAPGGSLVVWKGDDLDDTERSEGASAANSAGLTALDDITYDVYRPSRLVRYSRPESSDA
ncbi:MAG: 16S rRNA (guanine(527)-N(7))-methyltransferase RsmG [Planctomycetes bacterium]|nr:16S rRNA (guanine(527)-N(7))-methyltransferase RsmG [Planctomycetota bacterium]